MKESFDPRLYQERIFAKATGNNTLVVLPTGLGKTAIGIMVAEHRLEKYPDSKVFMLAPTKPLVNQHAKSFKDLLPTYEDDVAIFTGDVRPDERQDVWEDNKIIISTPQTMENDLISNRIDIESASLAIFDEAHRATGEYAYNYIAKKYVRESNHSRITALTASPGNSEEKILEVCENLFIDEIEYRSEDSEDVKQYVQKTEVTYEEVEFPEDFERIQMFLKKSYDSKLEKAVEKGEVDSKITNMKKTQLLKVMNKLHAKARKQKDYSLLKTISLIAEALKVQHALELLETQGLKPFLTYYDDLEEKSKNTKVKAVKNLMKDHNFKSARVKAKSIVEDTKHPKLVKAKQIIEEEVKDSDKIILFTQYRDTAKVLKDELEEIGVASKLFVGQNKKKGIGLTQKQQKEMIEEFEQGGFPVLIATSVGEEGLDIPEVDLVLFYEPVPSAIRTVQRRGRTGRQKEGKVTVLITKDTRDEGYRWSSYHKEKKMYKHLRRAKKNLDPNKTTLKDFQEKSEYKIKVDHREKGSQVLKKLLEKNIQVELEQLDVADYLINEDVAIEFKNTEDFVDSIVDNRLISQVKDLTQYKKPMIILQGEENLYTRRRVHPNAIRGMMYAITNNFNIPILRTKNPLDTAGYIKLIAEKEHDDEEMEFQMHSSKPLQDKELQEYIISSLPGIGKKIAKNLLEEFKTVKNIIQASEDELKNVELIGKKKAKRIKDIIDKEYEGKQ